MGHDTGAMAGALEAMHGAALRSVDEGIEALRPLYDRLPEGLRERAWAVAREFDPASCLASTTLYQGEDQPLADLSELQAIEVVALVVPGADPMHPAEIGEAYANALPDAATLASDEPLSQAIRDLCRRALQGAQTSRDSTRGAS